MKILFLSAASSTHTAKWVNALSERGHEVYLAYNSGHDPRENTLNKSIHLCPLKYSGGLAYYLNAKELNILAQKIKPDVINVHYASGYGTLARKAKLKNILLSVWGSDVYEFPYRNFINKVILKKNVKFAKKIASTSSCMAHQLKHTIDNVNIDIAITPFGVDLQKFTLKETREESNGPIILGTVKALEPVYGIADFIKAVALLKTDVKVYIYGDGSQKQELECLIQELSLEDKVFLKGRVPNAEVPKVLQELDVFCAMSEKESFGVAVVEAMAMELPVVVSDAEGFKEVVVEDETGFIVTHGDVEAMAQKLEILIDDKELRKEFGQAGRRRVEQLYDWEKNVDTMEQLYRQLEKI